MISTILFFWLLICVPVTMVNLGIADIYGNPGGLTLAARTLLWPIFLGKVIVLILLAGWKDLVS